MSGIITTFDDDKYHVFADSKNTQDINESHGLPPLGSSAVEISYAINTVKIEGYLNTDTLDLGVNVRSFPTPESRPISMGNFYGSLKDGLSIAVCLGHVQGAIEVYLKNGNQMWIKTDLSTGSHDGRALVI